MSLVESQEEFVMVFRRRSTRRKAPTLARQLVLLSVFFGIAMVVAPGAGAIALIWAIAFFAILFGIMQCMFAFRLRRLKS